MKHITLLTVIALLMPFTSVAQDDMYFLPSKQKNEEAKEKRRKSHETYYSGISKTDDEYNRRARYIPEPRLLHEGDTSDVIEFQAGPQAYPDTIDTGYDPDDFAYSRRMSRFDDYYYGWYDPWFHSNYYWGNPFWAWRAYDPWYNPWYDPFYDPWYDPFYRPWAFHYWGGIYSPWTYRPWGYYPIIAYYPAAHYRNPREHDYAYSRQTHGGTLRGNGGVHIGGMHSGDAHRLGNGVYVGGSRRGGATSVDVARRNGDVTNRLTGRSHSVFSRSEDSRATYYNNDNGYRSSSSSFGGSRSGGSFGGGGFGGGSHGSRGGGGRSTGRR